ncbi:urocanate hydratase [Allokutzneria sp. A3M-2-11 16]|uniref:urocanate hydratase n=1 Tax=Allokutzneria sp. A3M-2-11 16 TaxID=2962043 RepID=UPI0020B7EE04|nr:urocanate hydratase [Allokutzneria sp. A3M-2-11 16]MCP3804983.1 urocanate hydratase [Allokutzneria sp. A3M-2-11 16]
MIAAARGTTLRCRSWRAEALLRMLENVLEVGERPDDLVVYAAQGKAARDWPAYHAIVHALTELDEDQTLVLQSGRPVGVLRTHVAAPMVVSAVNNTVGNWATEEVYYRRVEAGQTIWGGLTAAAWQYIGRQGVLGGTYELLRAVMRRHFADRPPNWMLTAGMGGMGSAQPISARMLGLSSLVVEIDPTKIEKLRAAGGLDHVTDDLDTALSLVSHQAPVAVGLLGNAATVFAEIAARGDVLPDIVTDQTAAHDARHGYAPEGLDVREWQAAREADPQDVERRAKLGMAKQALAMLDLASRGAVVFENGNNLRVQAASVLDSVQAEQVLAIPGFMEGYLRPLFCHGIGPFRWVALSGDETDLSIVDELAAGMFPSRPEVAEWIALAREHVPPQGLPARSCWLGYGERSQLAVAVNDAVRSGRISAPVLFSRDHLDSAGMTHPRIGTEGMRDGSDGVTDWPLLDAMLLATGGADLVAVHSGGAGYAGWMQSAGVSVVADGSIGAASRLRLALDLDSGLGVLRHATAGYPEAEEAIANSAAADTGAAPLRWIDIKQEENQ